MWTTHVDHSTKPIDSLYDMIIGMDCMCSLGIKKPTNLLIIVLSLYPTWVVDPDTALVRGQ
jgi:hypothetical protein